MTGEERSEEELPPFPVDDATLLAVQHALNACTSFDENGTRETVGAEYTLPELLDFLSNTSGPDPDGRLIDAGDARVFGFEGAEVWLDTRTRYSDYDVIASLVAEILRLRSSAGASGSVGAAANRMARRWASIRSAKQRFAAMPARRQAELRQGIQTAADEAQLIRSRCAALAAAVLSDREGTQ
jgi:hypothetical protein